MSAKKMLICCPAILRSWYSNSVSWVCRELHSSQFGAVFWLMKIFAMALLTCLFALGGAAIGAITGAIIGQTTETGLSRGVGEVAGAITGVQLMELIANGDPFSKVALLRSLINGKIFMEWVSPAVLKAYQMQVSAMEMSLRDLTDIFDINTFKGLSQDKIKDLSVFEFYNAETTTSCSETSCAICLEDFTYGDSARSLPNCKHFFHLHCIDQWLIGHGSCPICRKDV